MVGATGPKTANIFYFVASIANENADSHVTGILSILVTADSNVLKKFFTHY